MLRRRTNPARTAVGVVQPPFHGVHDQLPDQASRRQEQSQQQQQSSRAVQVPDSRTQLLVGAAAPGLGAAALAGRCRVYQGLVPQCRGGRPELHGLVQDGLNERWSPEQIS